MSKITLQTISSVQNDASAVAAINANMAVIQAALDLLLSRDGTSPNQMTNTLDMNSQRIINLPTAIYDTEPVTQAQLSALVLAATNGAITPGSIIEIDYATGSVSTRSMADGSVTTVKIADSNVTAAKLAAGSVTTAKIGDQQVTFAKLPQMSSNTVLGNLSGSTAAPGEVTVSALATALLAGNSSLVPTGAIIPYSVTKAPTSWLSCDGSTVSRSTYATLFALLCPTTTVTFTVGSNQVNWTAHPFVVNDRVQFTTSGALPTGMTASTTYYVQSVATNSFTLSATVGGSVLAMSGSPTGTHTGRGVGWGLGDGSTTFNVPDLRGEFLRGYDFSRGIDTGRYLGSFQDHQLQDHIHTIPFTSGSIGGYSIPTSGTAGATQNTSTPTTGNHGTETRPRNQNVHFIIKT